MKKFLLFINLFLFLFALSGLESNQPKTGHAIFITNDGYAVTYYNLLTDYKNISAKINNQNVNFEVIKTDFINNWALIRPKEKINATSATLLMGELKINQPVECITKAIKLSGVVKELTGVNSDIRHIKINLQNNFLAKYGFIFSDAGIFVGMISNSETDIYSVLQNFSVKNQAVIVNKVEYLFPMLKDLKSVSWSNSDAKLSETEKQKIESEAIFPINIETKNIDKDSADIDFDKIKNEIPKNGLFVNITIETSLENLDFSKKLIEQIEKNKIGVKISQPLKQKYYKSIIKKFGTPSTDAEQLVKMASDLSGGYYMSAKCSIGYQTAEDYVELIVYKPQTIEIIADIKESKVSSNDPKNTLKELINLAVKKLYKELKDKNIGLVS